MQVRLRGKPDKTWITEHGDLLLVLILSLVLRLTFALLVSDTYDPDEFVYLTLSHAFSQGRTPYRDFMFFHPPGILVLLRAIDPLTQVWWPVARLFTVAADTLTAAFVWCIAAKLFGRKTGVFAGMLYAVHPIALLASVRIGEDPIITCLGMAGLTCLVVGRSGKASVAAGICLGIAVWCKYPAASFVPVYALASPRRAIIWFPTMIITVLALFAPFWPVVHQVYQQSIEWQALSRSSMDRHRQLYSVLALWLLSSPLAVIGSARLRPLWLITGFALGLIFLATSHVFYHYFVSTAAFGSVLGAPVAASFLRMTRPLLVAVALSVTVSWAWDINHNGPGRNLISASRFSLLEPAIRVLRRDTARGQEVLADRSEYAYLAHRDPAAYYYWDVMSFVKASYLERRLAPAGAVIFTHQPYETFPFGFRMYLNRHYPVLQAGSATIWLTTRNPSGSLSPAPRRSSVTTSSTLTTLHKGGESHA